MKDLRLWQLLQHDDPPVAELRGLLHELAGLPLDERFPFFGLLPRVLLHEDFLVRAAAVASLHGASGALAFRQIVRALHDPVLTVRFAAVSALAGAAAADFP